MPKYQPLRAFLEKQSTPVVRMTFAQIERLIGRALPESALRHRAWWSNNGTNNVMTTAWLDAGYKSEQVDMDARTLVFRRVARARTGTAGRADRGTSGVHPLIGWMKGTLIVAEGVDLTEPADPEWRDNLDREQSAPK